METTEHGSDPTGASQSLPPAAPLPRTQRTWLWIRRHPWRTLLLMLLAIVLVEGATIPWFSVARLRSENPAETALMRQRLSEAEASGKKLRIVNTWIPLARIPQHVIDAVIVEEDGTFFTHGGIDWFEVRASVMKNIEQRRAARGASTITQQLAKNLYLSTSKDPVRKAKEVVITLLLEHLLSKDRILEIYMNVIEWGRGIFGIEAAARAFFGKSASALTPDEGIRLAAVIPSPLRHTPNDDSRYVLRRSLIVERRLEARALARARHFPMPVEPPVDILPDDSTGGSTDSIMETRAPDSVRTAGEQKVDTVRTDTTKRNEGDRNGL